MAEVYGVKPKMFTKEWWPYYWMYYKWHTIGIVFVAASIAITAVQCAMRPKYDLVITYGGTANIPQDTLDEISGELSEYVEDIDGNEQKNVFVQQLNFYNDIANAQIDSGLQQKHDAELTSNNTFLYIYDVDELAIIAGREHSSETYLDVHEWLDEDTLDALEAEGAFDGVSEYVNINVDNRKFMRGINDVNKQTKYAADADEKGQYFYEIADPDTKNYNRKVIYTGDGVPFAISLEDSSILRGKNIKTAEFYICVRQNYSDKEDYAAAQRSAKTLANMLVD